MPSAKRVRKVAAFAKKHPEGRKEHAKKRKVVKQVKLRKHIAKVAPASVRRAEVKKLDRIKKFKKGGQKKSTPKSNE